MNSPFVAIVPNSPFVAIVPLTALVVRRTVR